MEILVPRKDPEQRRKYLQEHEAKIAADPKKLALRRAQQRAAHKRRYEADPEKYREKGRRYYHANSETELARAVEWRRANPDYHQKNHRLKRYGLDHDAYERMLKKQGGHCFFCYNTRVVVDHCHKTGRIRGLVCKMHNNSIRMFGDDIAGVERLLAYMRGPKK